MGGSLSAPSTLIDLQEDIRLMHENDDLQCLDSLIEGLSSIGIPFAQLVQGVQHVDDSCVFSKCLCVSCLEKYVAFVAY